MKLLIVESPTKAKTISKFLTQGYKVISSYGHVKDLPKREMGVDIEKSTFEPHYIIPREKIKVVNELKTAAKKAKEIYLATDEDREGEAISWHLANILGIKGSEVKRLVFHEITEYALEEALKHPRPLDINLVHAQQARRVLDRLVGYELSPLLWKKITRGLSAGRVQSVALRLIVEREQEIRIFKPTEYWTISGFFGKENFEAVLSKIQGKKLDKFDLKKKGDTEPILKELTSAKYHISDIQTKRILRSPQPPFRTSTLQQEANHKFGFSSKQTMVLAQQLYETGFITYMRTDSVNMSDKFLKEVKEYIVSNLGKDYAAKTNRKFTNKARGAQEAHEAIRPTRPDKTPDSLGKKLNANQLKLYSLIWKRALATQMADAILDNTKVSIENENSKYTFETTGQAIVFDGFLRLYADKIQENILPLLTKDQDVVCNKLNAEQHFTKPPARFSDATLVKALEEHGIGRPSTFAPTIVTIEERGYVVRDETKHFVPTEIGEAVNALLTQNFPNIVDLQFTAKMEDDLDKIADGKEQWQPVVKEFYYPFKEQILEKQQTITKLAEKTDETCPECSQKLIIRFGRFGKFLACEGYPKCRFTKNVNNNEYELNGQKNLKDVVIINKTCPECGRPLVEKRGRYGEFIGCSGYPNCKYIEKKESGTGVICPQCLRGELIAKHSKRGRTFYSCNKYPECKFALWQKPTGEKCKLCGSLLVLANKNNIMCSNKECNIQK